MSGWRGVWALARFGWRREWIGVGISLLYTLYVGGLVGFLLQQTVGRRDLSVLYVMVDCMYLLSVPLYGQFMNRASWTISRDDVYSKKMALWRTMPIPLKTIVRARLLNSIVQLLVIGSVFFLFQYAISPALRDSVTPPEWLSFAFDWICYGLAVNALFIWMELGCTGKRYVKYYLIFAAMTIILPVTLSLAGVHLFPELLGEIQAGRRYGWLLLGLLIAVASLVIGCRATLAAMRNRSYQF